MISYIVFSSTLVILLGMLISSTSVTTYAQNTNTNITLTAEQINEVEKDPKTIIEGCSYRLDQKLDPGKLCDSYSTYLHDKCERLDYLSEYCGSIAIYFPKRIIQKQCISNSPLPSDLRGIERCIDYFAFNSTYSKIPLILLLKGLSIKNLYNTNSGYYIAEAEFSLNNPNAVPMSLISISYKISKSGTNLVSGDLPQNLILCHVCNGIIKPINTSEFTDSQSFRAPTGSNVISSNVPFVIQGTYEYLNSSLGTVSKQFNFTSP